ncbi:hypothetical protein ACU4GH_31705 [Bradyrhizobium betae]
MPADALDAKVAELAAALVANSPNAVRESKRLVQEVSGRAIDDALLADTADRIAAIRASEEGREGVRSFLENARRPGGLPERTASQPQAITRRAARIAAEPAARPSQPRRQN